jgi:hypothetical protein
LQRALEGLGGPLENDVRLTAQDLTMRAGESSQTVVDVMGTVNSLPDGAIAQVAFHMPGDKSPEPAHIRLFRNRQVSPPASGFELDTGDGDLPCSLLALGLDRVKSLGPRCHFRGSIGATESPDGWQAEVVGQLANLDIGRLVSDHFPHKLTGTGDVTIQSASFRRGRLEEGSAMVEAGPGVVDRALLAAAVDHLGVVPPAEELPSDELVSYDRLAFLATLDSKGLHLGGQCKDAEKGTILSYGGNRLLGEPRRPSPVVALVRMLVPQNAVQVPASRQTGWFVNLLPVPDVMQPPGSAATGPQVNALRILDKVQR